ncbi:hypothetical protein ACOMHN_009707 [Nucella lapillus]
MMSEGGSVDDDVVARQLQPHLSGQGDLTTTAVRDSDDVRINIGNSSTSDNSGTTTKTWETFDDDDDTTQNRGARRTHSGGDPHQSSRDGAQPPKIPPPTTAANGREISTASTGNVPKPQSATDAPVMYHHQSGEVVVVGGGGGGSPPGGEVGGVIQTRHVARESGVHEMDRPLRPGRIKMLKAMSVAAAILFFPTGIPAVVMAWRIPGQLVEGIIQGNIDRALRSARYSQRLAILSGVLVVLVVVLTLALLEQARHGQSMDNSYLAHASIHG